MTDKTPQASAQDVVVAPKKRASGAQGTPAKRTARTRQAPAKPAAAPAKPAAAPDAGPAITSAEPAAEIRKRVTARQEIGRASCRERVL